MKKRRSSLQINDTSIGFRLFGSIIVVLLAVICVLPFILVISGSFTKNDAILIHGYSLIPSKFSLEAYKLIFSVPEVILNSYVVTIAVTAVGTMFGLFLTSMTAYTLHRRDFLYRNIFSFFFFFTTLFSGGLIPWYLLMLNLGMRNNPLALIVPSLLSVFNIIIMRTFFSTLPESIGESGRIDGANDFTVYFKLYLPMAIPGLATIGLFMALAYWNEWYNALLFISDPKLYPLQYQLYKIISSINFAATVAQRTGKQMQNVPTESIKLAMVCVTVGPIVLLFPYIQRYFIKGLTIGAVKG
jgi:putative aldouronate transport system permease protein